MSPSEWVALTQIEMYFNWLEENKCLLNNKVPGNRKEKELGFGCASSHYKGVKTCIWRDWLLSDSVGMSDCRG